MALRLVSYKVMVRFPTLDHLVSSGLATPRELLQLQKLNDLIQNRHQISWYPNMWAQNLLRKARKEGLIQNDWFAHVLIKEVDNMANLNGMLICYGWINIPLVYTQVVTLATYAYFVACLFGRQYLLPTQYKVEGDVYVPVAKFPSVSNWTATLTPGATNIIGYNNEVADFVIPVFTVLEYLFYMGWLKVAETLLNPFGEDDDDFDTYYLIDRNLQIAYVMVDEAGTPIDPDPDPFGHSNAPELKHTNLSVKYLDDERPRMPTDGLNLTDEQTNITNVTSRRGSKMLGSNNIGSRLNLAGNLLASPVTELNESPKTAKNIGNSSPSSFNMARHLLKSREENRGSALKCLIDIPDIIEEENPLTISDDRRAPIPSEWSGRSSPDTSPNENILFSVNRVSDSDKDS